MIRHPKFGQGTPFDGTPAVDLSKLRLRLSVVLPATRRSIRKLGASAGLRGGLKEASGV